MNLIFDPLGSLLTEVHAQKVEVARLPAMTPRPPRAAVGSLWFARIGVA